MKAVIYARVSSTNGTQDYQRQINDLTSYAISNKILIESVFAEKISGAKKNQDRQELLNMIDYVNSNQIDKVMVTELSRLGRDTLQVLQAIEILNQHKISLFIQNYNIETLTSEKQINPMSQFLITILAEVARMDLGVVSSSGDAGCGSSWLESWEGVSEWSVEMAREYLSG